jgi:hypothetical protein
MISKNNFMPLLLVAGGEIFQGALSTEHVPVWKIDSRVNRIYATQAIFFSRRALP